MNRESLFYIPCLCGAEVRSHERETECPECGRSLVVETHDPKGSGQMIVQPSLWVHRDDRERLRPLEAVSVEWEASADDGKGESRLAPDPEE